MNVSKAQLLFFYENQCLSISITVVCHQVGKPQCHIPSSSLKSIRQVLTVLLFLHLSPLCFLSISIAITQTLFI